MKKRANDLNGKDWARYSISIWNDIRKSTDEHKLKHPALFPEMLVRRLMECFTTSEEKYILDPFMGIGSALLAAANLGKIGIGFELNSEYVRIAKERLSGCKNDYRIYNTDARNIPSLIASESIDFCITSPPYWDILLQRRTADKRAIRNYGEIEGDLGRIGDYSDFLEALGEIFSGVFKVLKKGGYCVVNVMDIRKKSKFYPLHCDLAGKMEQIGFIFDDIIIWDRRHEYNNLKPLGYPYVFRINKIHEFLLIFKKPG